MLSLKLSGSWKQTENWLKKGLTDEYIIKILKEMGEKGVIALEKATPKKTGLTSRSWRYGIDKRNNNIVLYWTNDNKTKDGDMIAIIIQCGHGTNGGGYIKGRDYINPAISPIFDEIADEIEKAVMNE